MHTRLGLEGGVGRLTAPIFELKETGTKVYKKTFSRMSLHGGITRNARDYSGKAELIPTISGGVQAENATIAGIVNRTAYRTIDGAVQAQAPVLNGAVILHEEISGAVSAQSATVSGTVTAYPSAGWSLTDFSVDWDSLDPDSPFADAAYSAIVSGDKTHYETLTDPDAHTMTMAGNGEFTISPSTLSQAQEFDVQIYDISDGSFGTVATITVYPGAVDVSLSGAVSSQAASVSGDLDAFTVITSSGAVQSGVATISGVVGIEAILIAGSVTAQSATVNGSVERAVTSVGAVTSQPATMSGSLLRIMEITGNVQAQAPVISGYVSSPQHLQPAIDTPEEQRKTKKVSGQRNVLWKSKQRKRK